MNTYSALLLAGSWTRQIYSFFGHLGLFGPFIVQIADAFLFLPFSIDFLLVGMISASQSTVTRVLLVIMAALGSVAGAFLIDLIMRRLGRKGLEKFLKPDKIEKIQTKIERNTGWAMFTTAVMPPPFPYTPMLWTASALQSARNKMLVAILCGRLVRFGAEGLLAVYFGQEILRYADSRAVAYTIYAIIFISLAGSAYYVYRWVKSMKKV